ncbi:MAG: type III pantothenate kinase [Bacteroidales bacterium]|nr:type III pantothenate kinase [Bacteroidales bacterium]MDD4395134.1 type III pantothenate kinase [Bacteroidales bacterium]
MQKKYLVIDIGNTFQKAAVFTAAGEMVCFEQHKLLNVAHLNDILDKHEISYTLTSSVGAANPEIETLLSTRTQLIPFHHETPLPIEIAYQEPETLGHDRIAASVAAHALFPDEDVLVIQAGSCLVMDFVTHDGIYRGGSISPGIDMRFAALNHFTEKLPLFYKRKIDFLIGDSTQHSIESGIMNGIVHEINGGIERYMNEFGNIKIILTGGNEKDLQDSIKNPIFAAANLVLFGLYKILKFNVVE